jgi:hypothetical protein
VQDDKSKKPLVIGEDEQVVYGMDVMSLVFGVPDGSEVGFEVVLSDL